MGCLTTDSCCCCFSLRTGGIILGWLAVINSVLAISGYLVGSDEYKRILAKQHIEIHASPEQFLYANIIVLLTAVLFLYGIYSRRPLFMLPKVVMLVIGFIGILILIGLLLVLTILAFIAKEEGRNPGSMGLAIMIVLLPFIAIFWHFTAVSVSLYKQIKAENERHPGVAYHAAAHHDSYKV